jgi:hypothetical protein
MNSTHQIILQGLLLAKEGKWQEAHEIAQGHEGHNGYDRLHAFLHRQEGDEWNAKYWYKRCRVEFPNVSVQVELEELILYYESII